MTFAYIDPGAGSMLIQAILAGVLAVPFLLRTRLLDVARRIRGSVRPTDDSPAD